MCLVVADSDRDLHIELNELDSEVAIQTYRTDLENLDDGYCNNDGALATKGKYDDNLR